jgi:hypothetical protein
VDFVSAVYVLHAFQKKSTTGIATPKVDIRLIPQRKRKAIQIGRRQSKRLNTVPLYGLCKRYLQKGGDFARFLQ